MLYPRYDDFSDVSGKGLFNPNGYRFVEFPVFNLIHYLFYSVIGLFDLETWGRLTSVLAAMTSSVLIYFILKRKASPTVGLLGMGFFLFLPYNIFFTRLVLPENLMVTLTLATLLLFDMNKLMFGTIVGSLAIMVKPIAVFFFLPIAFRHWRRILIMLVPFGLWRIWEARFPMGIPANLWLLNGNGIRFKGAFFQWIFGKESVT